MSLLIYLFFVNFVLAEVNYLHNVQKKMNYQIFKSVDIFTSKIVTAESYLSCKNFDNEKENLLISQYSFNVNNNFGDFHNCQKLNNTFYLFVLISSDLYKEKYERTDISILFSELLDNDYFSFGVCLPKCYEIQNGLKISLEKAKILKDEKKIYTNIYKKNSNSTYYRVNVNNLSEKFEIYSKQSFKWNFYLILVIICVFILISIFFTFFPYLKELKYQFDNKVIEGEVNIEEKIKKFFTKSELLIRNSDNLPIENEFERDSIPKYYVIYAKIASIFDLRKNLNRFFKVTKNSNKITSRYKKDTNIKFINGIKAIILFLMNISTILWVLVLLPNTNIEKNQIPNKNNQTTTKWFNLIYYLNFSYSMFYSVNGFILAYKFCSYLKQNEDKGSLLRKSFNFILPSIHSLLIYLFMFILILNFDKIFSRNDKGPFTYFYPSISGAVSDKIVYFLTTFLFLMKENSILKYTPYLFFYIEANNIHNFILMIILIIFYFRWKNPTFIILIISYFGVFTWKIVLDITPKNNIINKFWVFQESLCCYILGVFFGILYYESKVIEINDMTEDSSFNTGSSLMNEVESKMAISRKLVISVSKSICLQIICFVLGLSIIIFIIAFDVSIYLKPSLNNYETLLKIYYSAKNELLLTSVYIFIYLFVIFRETILKKFLEFRIWTSISRSFYIIAYLQIPLAFIYVLNIDISLNFSIGRIFFLSISILTYLYVIGFIIMIFLEIPLKVLLKTVFRK